MRDVETIAKSIAKYPLYVKLLDTIGMTYDYNELLKLGLSLEAKVKAIQKRAESAESDWQIVEETKKRYEAVMRRCIKAMVGSNCLELQWLEEALKENEE